MIERPQIDINHFDGTTFFCFVLFRCFSVTFLWSFSISFALWVSVGPACVYSVDVEMAFHCSIIHFHCQLLALLSHTHSHTSCSLNVNSFVAICFRIGGLITSKNSGFFHFEIILLLSLDYMRYNTFKSQNNILSIEILHFQSADALSWVWVLVSNFLTLFCSISETKREAKKRNETCVNSKYTNQIWNG